MSATSIEKEQTTDFEALLAARRAEEPSWLTAVRKRGMATFAATGFPTTDHEEWRFTNLDPIRRGGFRPASNRPVSLSADELAKCRFGWAAPIELVFVDGQFAPQLSRMTNLPKGLAIGSLRETIRTNPAGVEPWLGRFADETRDPFVALNSAMMTEGAVVRAARGAVVEEPIHLLFVSTAAGEQTAFHPRNLVIAEENSQLTVVESYVASKGATHYFTNAATEVVAEKNAVVDHYMIELDGPAAINVSTLRAEQDRDSNFTSHSVLLGGLLVRNNVHPVLAGEGCQSTLNGLFVAGGRQHMDNFMRVEHARPHGGSRQFYKGILDGEGHGVFSGRIIVHKDAQKTDAKQTNMNLLLSDTALIDTKPQLEIYADDVKCTHGATIGQVDADAVFYLRSRGIPLETARSLLVYAFASESFGRMKVEPLRSALEKLVLARLPHSELLENLA